MLNLILFIALIFGSSVSNAISSPIIGQCTDISSSYNRIPIDTTSTRKLRAFYAFDKNSAAVRFETFVPNVDVPELTTVFPLIDEEHFCGLTTSIFKNLSCVLEEIGDEPKEDFKYICSHETNSGTIEELGYARLRVEGNSFNFSCIIPGIANASFSTSRTNCIF
jgi:hypothetical protein